MDLLAALLAVLEVLLGEHVQLAVQPARLVPEPNTQWNIRDLGEAGVGWTQSFLEDSPQQLGLAGQAVQRLDLVVHVLDLLLQVLPRHVHLLAQLGKHPGQLSVGTHTGSRAP